MYTARSIAALFPEGNHQLPQPDTDIHHICIDSRKAAWQQDSIFLALRGARMDGHRYIKDAWEQGIRTFLVRADVELPSLPEANFIRVEDVLTAFHLMARYHRSRYKGKVIALTGSNGKTWVKEWLYMLLYQRVNVYRSPGSYNSQVGVPLSVWNIPLGSEYAMIEAGISSPGEMRKLQQIIQPDIVLFVHLGDAHDEGFVDTSVSKLEEKLIMCEGAETILYPYDQQVVREKITTEFADRRLLSWGVKGHGTVQGTAVAEKDRTHITLRADHRTHQVVIPFVGSVPVSNTLACAATLMALGLPFDSFAESFADLQPIDMRLKAEDGIQGCVLINDSYSLDMDSLQFALDSLDIAGPGQKKTLILSDHANGRPSLYSDVASMIIGAGVDKLVCIGREVTALQVLMPGQVTFESYADVDEMFRKGSIADMQDEVILLKGARKFGFERIARQLRLRTHSAVLHVDFGALDHNLRYFYQRIHSGVKKIAVVKANAYGAGSLEVCRFLAYQHIDMLAVALIDEGVELREAGISIPVIVLNPDPEGMDLLLQHHLEPEIYNTYILEKLIRQCQYRQEGAVIHIKLDCGTHRLGFGPSDIPTLAARLRQSPGIKVGSVFTHLSGSDEPKWDDFTHEQARRFGEMYNELKAGLGYAPPRHILSTNGTLRFPEYQFECVRMGIGLYGVGIADHPDLMPVHSLKAKILHIQVIERGESVSYSRSYVADRTRRIATVNIGYADGLPRVAGNVGCSFVVHGKPAPITGRVCMDMTMIDVSDIPEAGFGDEVIIFDKSHSIEMLAKACNTIPYEIMTNLNPRVRKVYEHT